MSTQQELFKIMKALQTLTGVVQEMHARLESIDARVAAWDDTEDTEESEDEEEEESEYEPSSYSDDSAQSAPF